MSQKERDKLAAEYKKADFAKQASEDHKYNLSGSCDSNECVDYDQNPNNYDGEPLETFSSRSGLLPSQRFGL